MREGWPVHRDGTNWQLVKFASEMRQRAQIS